MISLEQRRAQERFWVDHQDDSDYNWFYMKVKWVQKLIRTADCAQLIGNVVVDVGGGQRPLSYFLTKPDRKILSIDFVAPKIGRKHIHHLKADIRDVAKEGSVTKKRALLKVADWLDIDPRTAPREQVDTLIFSDILNYVPYEDTIRSFASYLKENGTLVVLNQPGRGFPQMRHLLFDEEGVQTTPKMIQKIESLGFVKKLAVAVAEPKIGVRPNGQFMSFSVFQKKIQTTV